MRVENRNVIDVEVFLRPAGRRTRLGTVASYGLEFFEFSWPPGVPLDVELELSVGERFRLPAAMLRGRRVELYVAPELRRSTLRY